MELRGCRAELPQAQLLAKTAWAIESHAPAALHDMARRVADLYHLGVKEDLRSYQPGLRLAVYFPTMPRTRHDPYDLKQRRRVGLPSVRKSGRGEGYLLAGAVPLSTTLQST